MSRILVVDVLALAVYGVVSLPSLTSVAVHEWLGLAVLVVFAVHAAQHYDWVVDALRSLRRGNLTIARHGRLVLDVLIVVALATCVVSGVMISGAVLPAFGLYAQGYYFWDPLHAASAKVLLALLLVHVVVNAALAIRLWKRGATNDATGDSAKAMRSFAEANTVNAPDANAAGDPDPVAAVDPVVDSAANDAAK